MTREGGAVILWLFIGVTALVLVTIGLQQIDFLLGEGSHVISKYRRQDCKAMLSLHLQKMASDSFIHSMAGAAGGIVAMTAT